MFQVESCFQIRNFPVNIETTIVRYKIVSEVFGGGKKISRVRFSSSSGDVVHSNEKIVQVCISFVLEALMDNNFSGEKEQP